MRILPRVRLFLLVLCLGGTLPALAQDAGKIIDQYVRAAGGSGKRSKLQTLALEGSLTRASDGEAVTLLGQDALQLEAASTLAASHLLGLKKSKIGAAYVGHANVSSRDAVEIELTLPTGVKRQLYFDVLSHLLLKESGD